MGFHTAKSDVKIGGWRITEIRIAGGKVFVADAEGHVGRQLEAQTGISLPGKYHVVFRTCHEIRAVGHVAGIKHRIRTPGPATDVRGQEGMGNG